MCAIFAGSLKPTMSSGLIKLSAKSFEKASYSSSRLDRPNPLHFSLSFFTDLLAFLGHTKRRLDFIKRVEEIGPVDLHVYHVFIDTSPEEELSSRIPYGVIHYSATISEILREGELFVKQVESGGNRPG
jgi:hypothetical protein